VKVAVLGTGLVGRRVPAALREAGHTVRVLVRTPRALDPNLEVVKGDALNPADLTRLVEGCDAVVNCVGRLKNEGGFYAEISRGLLAAMTQHHVSRYLLITSSAVKLESDRPSLWAMTGRWGFSLLFPHMLADKQDEVDLVRDSSVEWTVFRLPVVHDGPPRPATFSPDQLKSPTVSNGQVAWAVVEELRTGAALKSLPFVS